MSRVATLPARWVMDDDGVIFPIEGINVVIATSANSVDLSTRRNNAFSSIKHLADASGHITYVRWNWGLQGNFGYYVRRYFMYPSAIPAANTAMLQINDNTGGNGAYVRTVSGGTMELHTFTSTPSDTTRGTTTMAMVAGAWYCWELYVKHGSGAGQCECAFRVTKEDGTVENLGPFTGLTVSTNMLTDALWGLLTTTDANTQLNSCDGAINSDQDASNNSWPGPVKNVLLSIPLSDNARDTNWLGGGGATTNLFNGVDNLPPVGVADGSSTAGSQIKNSNQAGAEAGNYDANMQSYLTAGATALQYVSLVHPVVAVGSSSTTNVSGAHKIVSNPAQGSEDTWTTGRSAAVGNYGTNWRSPGGQGTGSTSQTVQSFTSATAPVNGTQPVMRVGRRSAGAEAGNLSVCFMGIAFEVKDLPGTTPQVLLPMSVSPSLR